jgi:enediyne polyketide synthase
VTGSIGVVGIGCRLPGARNGPELERALAQPPHAAPVVPGDRWDCAQSPAPHAYLLADYDADFRTLRMPPATLSRLHRMERAVLAAMQSALIDAGLASMPDHWRKATSVHIGATTLGIDPRNDHMARVRMGRILAALDDAGGETIGPAVRAEIAAALEEMAPEVTIDSLMTTAEMAAGRFANAFDLGGGHLAYDAGIASSLAALIGAVAALSEGECDRAIVAGVSPLVNSTLLLAHDRRGLLASGSVSRALDAAPNGVLLGEAAVALVLERTADSERRAGRVYARIDGTGTAAAGDRANTRAVSECSARAARAALERAELEPAQVDYVECQAAGFPSLDAVELGGIAQAYAGARPTPLTVASSATHFGFTGAASGLLGAAVASLAIARGRRAGVETKTTLLVPDEGAPLVGGGVDWVRRAAVSSPGFGGVAHHVILSHPLESGPAARAPAPLEPIAITSLSAIVPGARDASELLELVLRGGSALAEMPPERFRWTDYIAQRSSNSDGGETHASVALSGTIAEPDRDPRKLKLPPTSLAAIDPAVLLSVQACTQALGAGAALDPERTGVWVGHLPLRAAEVNAERVALAARCKAIARTVFEKRGVEEDAARSILERFAAAIQGGVPAVSEDTLSATSSLECAARVAALYDCRASTVAVDAACASSLAAVHLAMRALRRREVDVAIVCGVAWNLFPEYYAALATLGALSFDGSRPFELGADGMVPAEGACAVVLKRHADALATGDRVRAVVLGSGMSSDGRGTAIFAPNTEGQELAMRRAFAQAGIDPCSIDLVEGHGAGTATGDAVEAATYRRVFGPRGAEKPVRVGSIKSNIGHLSSGAGLAGLVKATLALESRTLLPTRHAGLDRALREVSDGPIALALEAAPWPAPLGHPRRAGVSSFGLGGINAHVVLQEASAPVAGAHVSRVATRLIASSRPLRLPPSKPLSLAGASVVLIGSAHHPVTRALAGALRSAGADAIVNESQDVDSIASFERSLRDGALEKVAGVVDLASLDVDAGDIRVSTRRAVRRLTAVARVLHARFSAGSAFLIALGPIDAHDVYAGGGASAAFLRSMKREYPSATLRAIAIDPHEEPAWVSDVVLKEAACAGDRVEVGYSDRRRSIPVLRRAPALEVGAHTPRGVTLFSGGSRGIVFECARALASLGQAVAITGRTALPDGDEAWASADDADFAKLRSEALRNARASGVSPAEVLASFAQRAQRRWLARALDAARESGLPLTYHTCDVTSRDAVRALAAQLCESFGSLRGIVHGAMIEHSCELVSKDARTIEATLEVKLEGLAHLLEIARELGSEYAIGFGSVAGRFGNHGQADYAAANAGMAQLLTQFARENPRVRCATIEWTAWDEVGSAAEPATAALLREQGIRAVPVEEGVSAFLDEIRAGCPARAVVISDERNALEWPCGIVAREGSAPARVLDDRGAPLDPGSLPLVDRVVSNEDRAEVERTFSLTTDRWLLDHGLAGAPVLPASFALELAIEAAIVRAPGMRATEVRDFRIDAALRFSGARRRVVVREEQDGRFAAWMSFPNPAVAERRFCSGVVALERSTTAPALEEEAAIVAAPARAHHGSAFVGLEDPIALGPLFHNIAWVRANERSAIGCVVPPAHDRLFARSHAPRFACDPLALDAAFQIASHWEYLRNPRFLPIPVGFARWTRHADRPIDAAALVEAEVRRDAGPEITFDLTMRLPSGVLLASVEGLVLRRLECRARGDAPVEHALG